MGNRFSEQPNTNEPNTTSGSADTTTTMPPLPTVDDGKFEVSGQSFQQVGPVFTNNIGLKSILKHLDKNLRNVAQTDNPDAVIVVTGSGYHIPNGFSKDGMGAPRGIAPAKGYPGVDATLAMTIADIQNADSVKIRKNPLDKEAKELDDKIEALDIETGELQEQIPTPEEDDYDEELAKTMTKRLENLMTSRTELMVLRTEVEHKYQVQLADEKGKTVAWLRTLGPETCHICFVREIVKANSDEELGKPAWASGLIGQLPDKTDFVLDFGTQKVAATDSRGCQTLYENYDDEGWTIEGYIKRVKECAFTRGKSVVARLTGGWRNPEKFEETQDLIATLEEAGIPAATLSIEKEAEYGAKHSLSLIAGYYPDAKEFMVAEYGGGSHQGAHFKRI